WTAMYSARRCWSRASIGDSMRALRRECATTKCATVLLALVVSAGVVSAQSVPPVPRPPAPTPGVQPEGSAAPDGYAPIPMWLGQTRAPHPEKTARYDVQTVAEGISGAFSFAFLPDGRLIVAERPGRLKIVGTDGTSAEVSGLPSNLWARGQG